MTKDEALTLALEALKIWEQMYPKSSASAYRAPAITATKEALAQPVQRPWVGLTIEDKKEYIAQDFGGSRTDAMDWTEKRLMEKNT